MNEGEPGLGFSIQIQHAKALAASLRGIDISKAVILKEEFTKNLSEDEMRYLQTLAHILIE